MPYGGPFSEALGAAGLSHYAAQLLYKCASDPVTQDTFGRPNLPPAAIAGVHTAPGAADSAPAGGGGSDQRIISYSSEPTSISSSGLAKFPSEPFVRPRTVYPQYSAFDLPPGEFHDVAWVRPCHSRTPSLTLGRPASCATLPNDAPASCSAGGCIGQFPSPLSDWLGGQGLHVQMLDGYMAMTSM